MAATQVDSHAGQAVYSPAVLQIYDLYVLGFSCRYVWRCPSNLLLDHYNRHLGERHLDVGVGTGYFLDRADFPTPAPRITLFDLNRESLAHTARRIARYSPETVCGDVLLPNQLPAAHYDSIALSFLLHCLPSGGGSKFRTFDHLAKNLRPGGTLFGSTILGTPRPDRWRQRLLMDVYNRKGIFDNATDSLALLETELKSRFDDVRVDLHGVVACFSARGR